MRLRRHLAANSGCEIAWVVACRAMLAIEWSRMGNHRRGAAGGHCPMVGDVHMSMADRWRVGVDRSRPDDEPSAAWAIGVVAIVAMTWCFALHVGLIAGSSRCSASGVVRRRLRGGG
jgi:hypothetical protein